MSEAELKNVSNALGADLTSSAGIQAFVESLAGSPNSGKTLLSKLRSAREVNEAVLKGKLAGVNYVVEPKATETKTEPEAKPEAKSDATPATVRMRRKAKAGGAPGPIKPVSYAQSVTLMKEHPDDFEVIQ